MMRAAILLMFLVGAYGLPMFRFRRGMSATPFVINGEDADVGEWPWQCAEMVFDGTAFNCGCSIMDETHILIAAHCVDGWSPSGVQFLVGAHDIYTQSEGNPTLIQAQEFAEHPDYDYDAFGVPRFDVAVATVDTITYDDFIQPIPSRAPSGAGDVFVGQECYITGWGDTTAGGGQLPDVLQEAQIQVLELADCQERYSSTPYQVYDESICVFKLTDGDDHTGSCYGDSGGPLVCRESADADFVQAGLTSWGYPPCGVDGSADGLPSVYMALGAPEHDEFFDQFVPN